VLEGQGTAVTDHMCQLLFRNEEIRALFNQSHHGETGAPADELLAA
jgi:nitric oxide dioxygenase